MQRSEVTPMDLTRMLGATATMLALAFGLSACGGGSGDDSAGSESYCADLETAEDALNTIEGGDLSGLEAATKQIHTLRDEAPEAVAQDWQTLSGGFDQILSAFAKAGLDAEDLAGLGEGTLPADVDLASVQAAMSEIENLGSQDFTAAGDAIADHAKDECGLDLES